MQQKTILLSSSMWIGLFRRATKTMATMPLWLLLFMDLIPVGLFVINDDTLHRFCAGPTTEFPGGLPVAERIGDGYCVQLVPKKSADKLEAKVICQLYGPFQVYDADPQGFQTRCFWGPMVVCDRDEVPFYKQCLRKLVSQTLDSAKTACGNGNLLRISSRREGKWLLQLHAQTGTNLWVSNGIDSSGYMMARDRNIGHSNDKFDYEKDYKDLSLVANNDYELNIEIGMLVPTDSLQKLPSFCTRPGKEVPIPPNFVVPDSRMPPSSLSSVPHLNIGNSTVFLSGAFSFKNIYSTIFEPLDVNYMYEHCQQYGPDAFPLSPTSQALSELSSKGFLTGPVFVLGYQSVKSDIVSLCSGDGRNDSTNLRSIYQTRKGDARTNTPSLIDSTLWEDGYPKRRCSKYPSIAVVANKHGKLENFPSNARLPLLCTFGAPQPLDSNELCPNDNSNLGSDGKCQCDDSTIDITKTNVTDAANYPVGHICLPFDLYCTRTTRKTYVFYVIDDYDEWHENTKWLYKSFDLIPAHVGGGVCRYTSIMRSYFNDTWDRQAIVNFMATPSQDKSGRVRWDYAIREVYDFLKAKNESDISVLIQMVTEDSYYNELTHGELARRAVIQIHNEFQDVESTHTNWHLLHPDDDLVYNIYSLDDYRILQKFLHRRCYGSITTTTTTTTSSTATNSTTAP